ncbi:hypothetical protein [Aliamphritea ceti]|uniref:hypothetical protein n=1 Tax=Aliamphritea ceti TaxID=1524258 RepID=UPI0021C2F0DC|nr:hypothetical protein [Aliamphritea ceti]
MMRDRFIVLVNATTSERTKHVDFERETGIKRNTVKSLLDGKQRFNEEHITAISDRFPEYKMWFVFGETMPEAGQISPEIEEVADSYGETGMDTQ